MSLKHNVSTETGKFTLLVRLPMRSETIEVTKLSSNVKNLPVSYKQWPLT